MGNQKNLLKNNEMLILLAQGLIVAVQLYLLFCIYRLIDVWGVPLGFGVTSFLYFTIIKGAEGGKICRPGCSENIPGYYDSNPCKYSFS